MRLAWFSPMPPVASGIAACSAELVAGLASEHAIDVYVDEPVARMAWPAAGPVRSAHEFVWRHRRAPYDLTVFQLGNSSHHDYLWPYLFRYPGLAVLHDARLHHARAAALLRTERADDYRAEFTANHPEVTGDFAELAVAGFDTHLYYAWPMTRLVAGASRMVAVHTPLTAGALQTEVPDARIETVRLGHGAIVSDEAAAGARARVAAAYGLPADAFVFGVFGALSPEKRVPQVLDAFASVRPYAPAAHLILGGATVSHYDLAADVRVRGLEAHVTITGYLESDAALTDVIAASDVAISLRWPTAREVSGPWLRALAAGRPTVVVDLTHMAHVPTLDPRTWNQNLPVNQQSAISNQQSPVAVAIDIEDEAHSLRLALRRLASDAELRAALGAAGRRYWIANHSPDRMIDDYRRLIPLAAACPVPRIALPPHLVTSGSERLQELAAAMGVPNPLDPWSRL